MDVGPSSVWSIPQDGSAYYLSGTLSIKKETGDHPYMDWSGTLTLPSVAIPGRNVTEIPAKIDRRFKPEPEMEYALAGEGLFHAAEPGPAEQKTSIAWSMANEFVYRTSLAEEYALPAQWSSPVRDGVYQVGFQAKQGQQELLVEVDLGKRTLKLLRKNGQQQ